VQERPEVLELLLVADHQAPEVEEPGLGPPESQARPTELAAATAERYLPAVARASPGSDLLLVDGDCRICRRAAQALSSHLPEGCEVRSFREPGSLAGLPVDAARCQLALQLVEPSGRVSEGVEAFVRALRSRWYGPLLRLYYLPGARQALDAGYRWLARRRRAWGG